MSNTDHVVDRSTWGPGPWDGEPDKVQWIDEATGYACAAVRHSEVGHWCGYVGVPPGHRYHGVGYRDIPEEHTAGAHGELTYASSGNRSVCHAPESGRPDDVWWLGFDCAHAGDRAPPRWWPHRGEYRSLAYVRACVRKLAASLAKEEIT